jgi:predicted ester cyclase
MPEDNKQVVLGCWAVANAHDASQFDRYYAEDVVYHGNDGEIRSRDNVKAYLQGYLTALPNLNLTIEDIFGEGDRVFSRARLEGTNTGELRGMPPTGRRIDVRWIMNAARVQGGKIVEEWEIVDQLEDHASAGPGGGAGARGGLTLQPNEAAGGGGWHDRPPAAPQAIGIGERVKRRRRLRPTERYGDGAVASGPCQGHGKGAQAPCAVSA